MLSIWQTEGGIERRKKEFFVEFVGDFADFCEGEIFCLTF